MKTKSRMNREFQAIEAKRDEAKARVAELSNAPRGTSDWKKMCIWENTMYYYNDRVFKYAAEYIVF